MSKMRTKGKRRGQEPKPQFESERGNGKKERETCPVSQTREVKSMGAAVPIPENPEPFDQMSIQARNPAREVVNSWVRDQLRVRDAEIMWMARRRQLLIHEKIQIRKWQTRAFNACMQILKGEEGAQIKTVTAALTVWVSQGG
jgi:hypothetical protein